MCETFTVLPWWEIGMVTKKTYVLKSYMLICLLLSYLKVTKTQRGRSSVCWFSSPDDCNSWGQAKLKCVQVSCTVTGNRCLSLHLLPPRVCRLESKVELLYKMVSYLLIICTHSLVYFKSSLEYLMQCKFLRGSVRSPCTGNHDKGNVYICFVII